MKHKRTTDDGRGPITIERHIIRTETKSGQEEALFSSIEAILPLVKKPGRYIGGELNSVNKSWSEAAVRFCLIFPDLYEIGMSHQGLQILYHLLNRDDRFLAQRCYAPDIDFEARLREKDLPLFALESRRPLTDFDVLGFTLPYELCYTNILTVLDLAGLPLRACDRDESHPFVIGGGSCCLNPEPIADFFDAIVLGDGEEVIFELGECLLAAKQSALTKDEILRNMAAINGVYIPALFKPLYNKEKRFLGIQPLVEGYETVRRRVIQKLPDPAVLSKPLVPIVKPVHDRLGIEIARGCTRGCRFCQAGMIYRPVRERSVEDILELAEEGITNSGFDELAMLSLSTGDYSCLPEALTSLMNRFADEYVSVSMPSMRVGTLTPEIIAQIKRVRKTGFTVAPEAGTDRMREVINKGITEEDLLATCRDAFSAGWNLIKFYFMIGLPTETEEDVDAIVELAKKARAQAGEKGRVQINVSVACFVPKPHTPFQWHGQLDLDEAKARLNRLKKILPRKGFKLKWHDAQTSLLEGVFSRGDRRLSGLIETAWRSGVRLDGWSEHFRLENWQNAAEQCGLDINSYLRARTLDEPLPWDHLDCGVDRSFLEQEWRHALERNYTPDCRNHGCQKCGLCDFATIYPQTLKTCPRPSALPVSRSPVNEELSFRYAIHYARLGDSRFYGHLELLQLVFRVLRRAGLPVLFSRGYNPSPRVSFSQALPVGMESLVEHFLVDLARPIADTATIVEALNREFPQTIRVSGVEPAPGKQQSDLQATYRILMTSLPGSEIISDQDLQQRVQKFLAEKEFIIERFRKRKRKTLDIRPLVTSISLNETAMELVLVHPHGRAGVGPFELLQKMLGLTTDQARMLRIMKTDVQAVQLEV
ncbi:MAG TPA: TIGR03960 family B12-binding radical SAM protein [Desulfobulbaceae bacterium]|nr:TIGR03960 family B12-binding radical SAM protein [Desulfobulbaceae bacterium]